MTLTRRAICVVLAVHGLYVWTPAVSKAQTSSFEYSVSCATCRIQLNPVATLDASEHGLSLDTNPRVARDGRGRYFAVAFGRTEIIVFDSTGAFLRTLGRSGSGPGEFRAISDIVVGPGDSLFVVDPTGRISVFDPDLLVRRSIAVPGSILRTRVLPDSRLLLHAHPRRFQVDSGLLHLLTPEGRLLHSFPPGHVGRSGPGMLKSLAVTGNGVWFNTVDLYGYVLHHWSFDGRETASIEILGSPWFRSPPPPIGPPGEFFNTKPPRSTLHVRSVDHKGRIWAHIAVADAEWQKTVPSPNASFPSGAVIRSIFDTVIEVIDPVGQKVVVSERFDLYLESLGGTELLWSRREDAHGDIVIDLWKATIIGPST